jgi:hypothetical protein
VGSAQQQIAVLRWVEGAARTAEMRPSSIEGDFGILLHRQTDLLGRPPD